MTAASLPRCNSIECPKREACAMELKAALDALHPTVAIKVIASTCGILADPHLGPLRARLGR